jgi:hypothetical protein
MSNLQLITRERHGTQRWLRYTNYRFAAHDTLAVLVLQELPKAMLHLPIGFLAAKEGFVPVAIQGLKPGKNLLLAQNGQWLGPYVPAIYRSYPFRLVQTQDGKQVLAFDESSGLLSSADGEYFFDEDGRVAPALAEVLTFLTQVAANRNNTERVCALLHQHQLIQPWPITLKSSEGEQTIEGLHRIDEEALNRLPTDALLALRDAGALLPAYCQLLSMQHLPMLGQLADAHAKADALAAAPVAPLPSKGKDLDLSFLEGSETFKFY